MRFFGKVGYGVSVEKTNGVWEDTIAERQYFGDVQTVSRRLVEGGRVNSNLTVSNVISILADPFANDHFHAIKYVEWEGALWEVTEVTVQRPRLLLRLGGVYEGQVHATNPARRDTGE